MTLHVRIKLKMGSGIRHICEDTVYAVYVFEVFVGLSHCSVLSYDDLLVDSDSELSLGTGSGAIQCLPTCRCFWFSYHLRLDSCL